MGLWVLILRYGNEAANELLFLGNKNGTDLVAGASEDQGLERERRSRKEVARCSYILRNGMGKAGIRFLGCFFLPYFS